MTATAITPTASRPDNDAGATLDGLEGASTRTCQSDGIGEVHRSAAVARRADPSRVGPLGLPRVSRAGETVMLRR